MRIAVLVALASISAFAAACPSRDDDDGEDAGPDAAQPCRGDDVVLAPPPVDAGPVFETEPCEPPALFDAPGTLCGSDGWCWDSPTGGVLAGSVGAAAGELWVGYARGEGDGLVDVPLRQMPFAEVPREPVGGFFAPRSWSGVAPNDVWAIVDSAPIHYDGTAWQLEQARTCRNVPLAIYAAASDDVWLVGSRGERFQPVEFDAPDTLAHFDGSRWESIEVPEQVTFVAVDGRGPDDVWFVGSAQIVEGADAEGRRQVGAMGHFDGVSTTVDVFAALPPLVAVYVHADGTAWASGARAVQTDAGVEVQPVLFARGAEQCTFPQAPCDVQQLAGVRGSAVWARCLDGDVARFDGTEWQRFDGVGAAALAVLSDDEAWTDTGHIVGGAFRAGNPFGPATQQAIVAVELGDVDGADAIAMTTSELLERTDGRWRRVELEGPPRDFVDLDVNDGIAMALSLDGVALFDGAVWRIVDAPLPLLTPADLCVVSATEAYAVDGNQGLNPGEGENEGDATIARFDGQAWAVEERSGGVFSVLCAGEGVVVGDGDDTVWLRDDGGWTNSASPSVSFTPLYLVPDFKPQLAFAHSPAAWWVSGGVQWDGTQWRRGAPADDDVFVATATHGADGNGYALAPVDPFAAGAADFRLERIDDAGTVTTVATLTLSDPQKMFGSPSGALWALDFTGLVRIDLDGGGLGATTSAPVAVPELGANGDLLLVDDTFALTWRRGLELMQRWDGAVWSEDTGFPPPTVPGDFPVGVEDLFGLSASDVWAAYGRSAELAHWDGGAWTVVALDGALPGEGIYAVWGAATDEVWAVGKNGSLWRGSAAAGFVRERAGAAFVRLGETGHAVVVGSAPDDLWFLGVTFQALHWDGVALAAPRVLPNPVAAGSFAGALVLVDRDTGELWQRDAGGAWAQSGDTIDFVDDAQVQTNLRAVLLTGPRSGRALAFSFSDPPRWSLVRFSPDVDERVVVAAPRTGFALAGFALDDFVIAGARGVLRRQQ